jgi:tetratricopeptide (TPR) repeat protein
MQFEHIKKRIIHDLIDEILLIGASELEQVGHTVIELIEAKRLIHHGLNKEYRPAGYTVDTFSQDGTVVGEYSVTRNYFEDSTKKGGAPKYEKIENDIDHALAHGNPTKIYLISSQEEPESFRAKFLSTEHGKRNADLVNIIDARELAKYIYDFSVASSESAAFFTDFFPDFSQNLNNYEYYGRVPGACEAYYPEEAILKAIRTHFAAGNNVCVLYGLSGSGKTQAAIDFVHKEMSDFENYIWISGQDWNIDAPLSSIQRVRGGMPFNVAGAFNSRKTLLVIDSLERATTLTTFAELKVGFALGGLILVTSQLNAPGNTLYVATPTLSFETAAKILGETPENISAMASKFVETCRFSPLILATTRNLVAIADISKDELYNEVLSNPDVLAQSDGTSIMKALLKRLDTNNLEALIKIADSGSTVHDSKFLAYFVGQLERINLQRLAILQPGAAPGVLKVHDLIFEAVQRTPRSIEIAAFIESYVEKQGGEMVPSVLREIHLCSDRLHLADEARGVRRPDWLLYSLLQVDHLVPIIWEDVCNHKIHENSSLAEVLCIVDAKEVHSYAIEDHNLRREYYMYCAAVYQRAIELNVNDDIRAELLHHQGKTLRRCNMFEDAYNCFLNVLELRPNWHATHGQITRIGAHKDATDELKAKGEQSIRWLVDRMMEDLSSVPLRVSLATITSLRSYRDVCNELSKNSASMDCFAEAIAMSALEGLDQFYEAYLSFTTLFGYHHSSVCVALAEALPDILTMPPESVQQNRWASACESLTNTATAAGRLDKLALEARLNKSAATFAAALDSLGETDTFVARVIAKTYISAGMPQLALDRLDKTPSDKVDHWLLYQKSRAQLELNLFKPSLQTAELALESAKQDTKATNRLAIYFDQISKCAEKLNDFPMSKSFIKEAIAHCKDAQYLHDLKSRLQLLEGLDSSVKSKE